MELTDGPRTRLQADEGADGTLVLAFAGELDLAGLPGVERQVAELLTRAPRPVVMDLGELEFLDSSGIAVLVRVANHFGDVRTRAATPPVRRVIQVLGLADRFGLDGG